MEIKMKLTVGKGRPESDEGRSRKEIAVYDYLDKLGIPYERADHAEAHTMEDCEEVSNALGAKVCKNLFLTNSKHSFYYLLMMPGNKPFKTAELSREIGCGHLSFAEAEEMERVLGCTPGSASVFGLMHDKEGLVELLVDRDLLKDEYLGAHPCHNIATLKVKTKDIFTKFIKATKHYKTEVTLRGQS